MKINWKVRFKNKTWVLALIATLFFIIQSVLVMFGVTWDYTELLEQITTVVAAVFALLGLIIDPTTAGASDSAQAQNYGEPRKDEEK
ncbi:phage holin [Listeria monocytogenes]|nr:phage holin [Listeria monocytogenes]